MKSRYQQLRVGLIGLGLEAYWAQLEDLKTRLQGCVALIGTSFIDVTAPDSDQTRILVQQSAVDRTR